MPWREESGARRLQALLLLRLVDHVAAEGLVVPQVLQQARGDVHVPRVLASTKLHHLTRQRRNVQQCDAGGEDAEAIGIRALHHALQHYGCREVPHLALPRVEVEVV